MIVQKSEKNQQQNLVFREKSIVYTSITLSKLHYDYRRSFYRKYDSFGSP